MAATGVTTDAARSVSPPISTQYTVREQRQHLLACREERKWQRIGRITGLVKGETKWIRNVTPKRHETAVFPVALMHKNTHTEPVSLHASDDAGDGAEHGRDETVRHRAEAQSSLDDGRRGGNDAHVLGAALSHALEHLVAAAHQKLTRELAEFRLVELRRVRAKVRVRVRAKVRVLPTKVKAIKKGGVTCLGVLVDVVFSHHFENLLA